MAGIVDYEPSEAGWRGIAFSPDIRDACIAEARRGQVFAEVIAPEASGEYKDSFDIETTVAVLGDGPRVAARLVNDAPHAPAVEFGNKRTPKPHRVLGRTAAFLGSA